MREWLEREEDLDRALARARAVTGQVSREIAQALFVTEKTVETHLGRSFSRLGVRSPKQLAEALAQVA